MADTTVCYHRRMAARALFVVLLLWAGAPSGAAAVDALANARKLYNLGQYDRALDAAREAEASPTTVVVGASGDRTDSARALSSDGRARRSRRRPRVACATSTPGRSTCANASSCRSASPRCCISTIGSAPLPSCSTRSWIRRRCSEPEGHERALDWWASALDRYAQRQLPEDRGAVYERIIRRMEEEVRRDASSTAASYWLVAATRGAGDLDRSWAAASRRGCGRRWRPIAAPRCAPTSIAS